MSPRKCHAPVLLCASLALAGPAAWAGDDVHGASRAAMGGASAAAADDDASVTVNPGLLGLPRRYDLDFQVLAGRTGDLALGGTIVDSRTAPLGFGLTYQYDSTEPPLAGEDRPGWLADGEEPSNVQRENEFTVGVGVPLLDRRLSLGLNASVGLYSHDRGGKGVTNDFDLGVGAAPAKALTLGFVARNVVPYHRDLDDPAGLLAGAQLTGDAGSLAADVGWQLEDTSSPLGLAAGAALTPGQALIRAGYRYEGPLDLHTGSWGLGAENEHGAIEYAMGIPLEGSLTLGALLHQFAIRIKT